MRMIWCGAAAMALIAPLAASQPSAAATAYQTWSQGRGAYVSSKERGWTWRDDLNSAGIAPPPGPGYYYPPPPPPPPGYWDDDQPSY